MRAENKRGRKRREYLRGKERKGSGKRAGKGGRVDGWKVRAAEGVITRHFAS